MGESARRLCCFKWEVSTFIGVDGCEGLLAGEIVWYFVDLFDEIGDF